VWAVRGHTAGYVPLGRSGQVSSFVQVLADGVPQLAEDFDVAGATVPLPVEGLNVSGLAGGDAAGVSPDELGPALALA
jgi:hypothetical protein